MKLHNLGFLTTLFVSAMMLIAEFGYSQSAIENLIVETYYISDTNDAAHDDEGTNLPEGSITYRVFLDLAPGYRVSELFGTDNNPWFIRSTELIWNNSDRGKALGSNLGDNRLDENTVALDSYITIGAASTAHYGVPKSLDSDGSIVGGDNNDGGSQMFEDGLLINMSSDIGIPLTEADGLIEADESLIPMLSATLIPDLENVFGAETLDSTFVTSSTVRLQPTEAIAGVTGENIVFIAQITTLGELEFNFNVTLLDENDDKLVFVADNAPNDTILSPFLSFPPDCGCTDPDFLEFDPAAPCDDGSCVTLIQFGCSDPEACNFNPDANFNIPQLCCYGIDDCNNLDWTLICPTLSTDDPAFQFEFKLYPNPTISDTWVSVTSADSRDAQLSIYTIQGQLVRTQNVQIRQGEHELKLVTNHLPQGTYLVRLHDVWIDKTSILVKN
jgi:hypothetical protein